MKNIILTIILGLFAVGCFDENPFGSNGGCDLPGACEKWECVETGAIYGDYDYCLASCEGNCVEIEE